MGNGMGSRSGELALFAIEGAAGLLRRLGDGHRRKLRRLIRSEPRGKLRICLGAFDISIVVADWDLFAVLSFAIALVALRVVRPSMTNPKTKRKTQPAPCGGFGPSAW